VSEQPCAWEYYVTDVIHQRIKLLNSSIDLTDSFIKMIQFTKYSDGSFALMKYYKNGTLLDLVNYHVQTNQHIPYWFVIYLTIELLSIINGLHKCKIIHADVKPDNIMVDQLPFDISFFDQTKTKSLVLIDFNQSIDLNLYPETVEFNNKITAKFKLCQFKADNNWTFQVRNYSPCGPGQFVREIIQFVKGLQGHR
jgi:checkpoint serine/threonine-protein kinase